MTCSAASMKKPKKIASLLPFVPVSLLAFGGLLLAIQSACSAGTANSGNNNGTPGTGTCGYEYYGVCYDDYDDYAYGGTDTSDPSPAPTSTVSSSN